MKAKGKILEKSFNSKSPPKKRSSCNKMNTVLEPPTLRQRASPSKPKKRKRSSSNRKQTMNESKLSKSLDQSE